jgi:DNA-binding MarR family transcriptional regulator
MGIISKGEDTVKKSRIRYSLTQKGIDLLPILLEMIIWGGLHDDLTESPKEFMNQAIDHKESLINEINQKLIEEHLSASAIEQK